MDNNETDFDIYDLAVENIREARIRFVAKLEEGVLKGDLSPYDAVSHFRKAYPNNSPAQAESYLAAFGVKNGPFKLRWGNEEYSKC